MTKVRPRRLFIGVDGDKIVIAPYPLKMGTGKARRRRTGSVTEIVPVPPSGRSRPARLRFAGQLGLVLLFLSGILNAAGLPGWIAVPAGTEHHVLVTAEERTAYAKALVVARRIRTTWPALENMIDPVDADRALTRALDDLAAELARRQDIRRLRAELADVDHRDLPPDSPAVRALIEQRRRLDDLWRAAGATANRILAGINAAALAGDNLVRERRIGATADRAEQAIAQLTAAGTARSVDAGPDLAERTAAVVAAYRELAAAGR
jgi:hypothetical protein